MIDLEIGIYTHIFRLYSYIPDEAIHLKNVLCTHANLSQEVHRGIDKSIHTQLQTGAAQ